MKDKLLFPVYNKKIAEELSKLEFRILKIEKNKINQRLDVFMFQNDIAFQTAFKSIKEKHKAEKELK
jgi:hypothetical protein